MNMEPGNHPVKIFSGSEEDVANLKTNLENHSIPAMYRDEIEDKQAKGLTGTPSSLGDLYINSSDVRRADPLIKKFTSQLSK